MTCEGCVQELAGVKPVLDSSSVSATDEMIASLKITGGSESGSEQDSRDIWFRRPGFTVQINVKD